MGWRAEDKEELEAAYNTSETACAIPDPKKTGYQCSRPKGHTGDHVAAACNEVICARWPQEWMN